MKTEWRWLIGAWLVVISIILVVIWLGGGVRYAHSHESWISKNRLTDPASGEWCCASVSCYKRRADLVLVTPPQP